MSIWNKRGKFPKDFTDTRGLFVYQFDDGVDVEEYDEAFIYASNLIRWCRWNDLVYFEKQNKQQQTEIDRLKEALKSVKQQTINLGDYEGIGAITTISDICDKALNGESEER